MHDVGTEVCRGHVGQTISSSLMKRIQSDVIDKTRSVARREGVDLSREVVSRAVCVAGKSLSDVVVGTVDPGSANCDALMDIRFCASCGSDVWGVHLGPECALAAARAVHES